MTRQMGVTLVAGGHCAATLAVVLYMNIVYMPVDDLVCKTLLKHPELAAILNKKTVLIGVCLF